MNQNVQRKNAPSPGGRPSTVGVSSSCRYLSTKPSCISSRRTASSVPRTRGSSAGRNPKSGIVSRLASSRFES